MKTARFYCENCGREVRAGDKICPYCKRFFSSVRCPACSFSGPASLFVQGCPACGYASPTGTGDDLERYDPEEVQGRAFRRKAGFPPWFYSLVITILALSFGVLVLIYLNL
jgi:ssDNA-binding Zn-finger/Zn-ribbon topoisomerase 1